MNDATLSMTLNGVTVPKDVLLLIFQQLEKMFRTSNPKQWGTVRLVCNTFNELISEIEDKHKCLFYNDVAYPTDDQQFMDEQIADSRNPSQDLKFSFSADKKVIAVQQLGRLSIHHLAPILTCDESFKLKLYELNSANPVCEYNEHKARLTVAISVGKHTVSADENGFVGIWSLRYFQAHKSAVTAIDYLPRSQFVTGGGSEVKFWDLNLADPVKTLTCDGIVKAIQAKSANELLVLTLHPRHTLKLTHFLNDEPIKTIEFNWNETAYPFSICDEIRIVSPNKVVGLKHNQRKKCFSSVEFKEPEDTQTKAIISRYTASGSLSRAQYCMFFKQQSDQVLEVTISLEPAVISF